MLSSLVGIQRPKANVNNTQSSAVANTSQTTTTIQTNKQALETTERTQQEELAAAETIRHGFTVSPNPARNQVNVTYQFPQATDAAIEVKAASGQVINRQILSGVTIGNLPISTVDYASETYFVTLQYGKEVQTKPLIVRH